jgi:integrase
MLCLNGTQVEALANAIDPHYSLLIRFAAYTGMRAGEIGALRVSRINFLRGRVVVAESLAHVNGERHTWQTKNNESRVVKLPRFLVEQLSEHCAGKGPDDLAFVTKSGREIRHNDFYGGYFKPAVQKAKLNRDPPRLFLRPGFWGSGAWLEPGWARRGQ